MNDSVIEMNEVIALFDGWKFLPGFASRLYKKNGKTIAGCDFQYHTSWDWLMPVVEKISKMPLLNHDSTVCTDPRDVCHPITFAMPTEDGKKVMFRFKGFSLCIGDTLIEAAHEACYEVAEYHINQQKQTNE